MFESLTRRIAAPSMLLCATVVSNSSKIDETTRYNYACNENLTQIFGGCNALTVYNTTATSKSGARQEVMHTSPWMVLLPNASSILALA